MPDAPAAFPPPPGSGELIDACVLGGVQIEVRQARDLRWLCAGGGGVQTAFRPASPHQLLLQNHHHMLAGLANTEAPARVLNLGFGGGAFERLLRARWPALELRSVDVEPGMVVLARRHFMIPAWWPVAICDACDYLREGKARYDLILCDIFRGEQHDAALRQAEFYAAAAARLAPGGAMALNLAPGDEQAMLETLLVMRSHFRVIRLAAIHGHDNVVALLSHEEPARDQWQMRLAGVDNRLGTHVLTAAADFTTVPGPAM